MVLVGEDATTAYVQEAPKLIQPRSHTAKICIWADLSVDDIDRLNESQNADHIKKVLAEIFHLDDYQQNLKTGVLLDLYYYTVQFARDHAFSKEQTSTLFSIVKQTHEVCVETPFGNVDQTFAYFKELILCHAVNRPPHSIELFSADEVKNITEYVINTYFRHFKMYKYAFTPLVRLDLSVSYIGMPDPPPEPEESGVVSPELNAPEEGVEGHETPATDREKSDLRDEPEPKPEESAAKKELRSMIKNYLAEEMKKMRMSVEEQLKTTEDALNKKLEVVEGATAKKGGKGSAKGKRK